MEGAPLNLAHFYERKANKFLKHHRFEDAVECLQKSLEFIGEAYQTVEMPMAVQVLIVQEEEYKRQIKQIQYKKAYFDSKRLTEEICSKEVNQGEDQTECRFRNTGDLDEAGAIKASKQNSPKTAKNPTDEEAAAAADYKIYEDERRLLNLDIQISEIPNLAPLELPNFDFQLFQCAGSSKANVKKD